VTVATGFFHPDRLTFGDDLYLSRVIASPRLARVLQRPGAAMQRQFEAPNREIQNGLLPLGPSRSLSWTTIQTIPATAVLKSRYWEVEHELRANLHLWLL